MGKYKKVICWRSKIRLDIGMYYIEYFEILNDKDLEKFSQTQWVPHIFCKTCLNTSILFQLGSAQQKRPKIGRLNLIFITFAKELTFNYYFW